MGSASKITMRMGSVDGFCVKKLEVSQLLFAEDTVLVADSKKKKTERLVDEFG